MEDSLSRAIFVSVVVLLLATDSALAQPKEGGGIEIIGRPNYYWVDSARAEGPTLRERYRSPTVLEG
jgi:hypothetical protein